MSGKLLLLGLLFSSSAFIIFPAFATDKKVCIDKKISIDLQDSAVHNAFRILAEICKLNIILDPKVEGKITIRLLDVPANQALEIFLRQTRLEMEVFSDPTGTVHTVRLKNAVEK